MRLWICLGVVVGSVAGCASPTVAVADVREEPSAAPDKGEPFRLPTGEVGLMLAKVLPPSPPPERDQARPTPATPPRLAEPPGPDPVIDLAVPRLPLPSRRQPRLLHFTLAEHIGDIDMPAAAGPSLPTARRVKVDSENAAIPPPLPAMATRVPDRVPVDDPTLEFSTAAALASPLPRRGGAVPFVPSRVPDPFPYRGAPSRSPEETVPP
jgi:hypothetical protein